MNKRCQRRVREGASHWHVASLPAKSSRKSADLSFLCRTLDFYTSISFRQVRDEIKAFIETLPESLEGA